VLTRIWLYAFADSKKPRLGDGNDRNQQQGIGGLIQQQRRLMQEAALDRKWEAMLLKAQLKDAEDKIAELQKQINPGLVCSLSDADLQIGDEEDNWTPSSLLSLRRVCMHIRPGEFVAVVGAVGSGKVGSIGILNHLFTSSDSHFRPSLSLR